MPIRLPFCYIMPIQTTYTASDCRFSCLFATYAASDCRFSRLSAARAASDWRFRCFLLPRTHLIGDLNSLLLLMLLLIANSAASFLLLPHLLADSAALLLLLPLPFTIFYATFYCSFNRIYYPTSGGHNYPRGGAPFLPLCGLNTASPLPGSAVLNAQSRKSFLAK